MSFMVYPFTLHYISIHFMKGDKIMFTMPNLKKVIIAVLFTIVISYLDTTDVDARPAGGTRINVGFHAVGLSDHSVRFVVHYVNVSDVPININQIKIYRPDGSLESLESSDYAAANFPEPPFVLGPFGAVILAIAKAGIPPDTSPFGDFQVRVNWDSQSASAKLHSWSVMVSRDTSDNRLVSKHTVEGFDIK